MEKASDQNLRYLVLLVDREKAIIFTVYQGKIEHLQDVYDESVPQNVKAKKVDYGREDKIFRHIEWHLHLHLQNIVQITEEFIKDKPISFIILAGHEELLPKMKKHLSDPLDKIILEEFITELNIPIKDVLDHSKKVAEAASQKLAQRVRKTRQIIR